MTVLLRETAFSPYRELDAYEQQMVEEKSGKCGATAVFVGSMRDFNLGEVVTRMMLEYYPGMTERQLGRLVEEARARWNLIDALVIHRIGEIYPNEAIVLVAVWCAHRGAAFDSCRYIIEELKHNAPFWKKETLENAERWVESNTDGYD